MTTFYFRHKGLRYKTRRSDSGQHVIHAATLRGETYQECLERAAAPSVYAAAEAEYPRSILAAEWL